jgi:hypothetical protein
LQAAAVVVGQVILVMVVKEGTRKLLEVLVLLVRAGVLAVAELGQLINL